MPTIMVVDDAAFMRMKCAKLLAENGYDVVEAASGSEAVESYKASAPDGVLLDALGIRHHAGRTDGADIAFPTAVLVDATGTVRWTFQSDTFRERARPEEVFAALATLRVSR